MRPGNSATRLLARATVTRLVPAKREHVNYRITDEGKAILYALQDWWGVSQSGAMEMLLRETSRQLASAHPEFAALLKKHIKSAGKGK